MTDITIDEATGLPELPGDQYWKFERLSGFVLSPGDHGMSGGHYITIMMDVPTERWSDWQETEPIPSWAASDGEVEVRHRKIPKQGLFSRAKKVFEYRYKYTEEMPMAFGTERVEPRRGNWPDATDIRGAARRLVRRDAERAKGEALYGCYPPNKLEVN